MILRDPVHGLVTFESQEQRVVERLLEAKEVQRLRRIRQLGLTSLAYPGADHTRFSHAIGTAHVMARFVSRMRVLDGNLSPRFRVTDERARDLLAAALLHDVGHGPFSHLFEVAAPVKRTHEQWSELIVTSPETELHRLLAELDPELPSRICHWIRGENEIPYLARAVSGTFDVDRCDYLLRDAHFTGVNYGKFDLDWLLRSFCITPGPDGPTLAIDGQKGLPAIESFILARLFMFQQVYFHKASRASEWLLGRVLARLGALVNDGEPVAGMPIGLREIFRNGDTELAHYLALDDACMWTLLQECTNHRDPILADLSGRILHRRLFKSWDLFGEEAQGAGPSLSVERVREIAIRAGLDPEYYVGVDTPSVVAFDDTKDPISVRFPDGSVRAPADVSFLLGRLRGEVLTRPRIIFAPELREFVMSALGPARPDHGTLAGGSFAPKGTPRGHS